MSSLPGQVTDNRQYYLLKDQGKRMMMVMVMVMAMMTIILVIVMMVVMKKAGVMSNHLERLSEVEA